MSSHRFSYLNTSERLLDLVTEERLLESLHGVRLWLSAATTAAGRPDKCCRNALYHADGSVGWLYPNSNTPELISTWLDLAELLEEPELTGRAIAYADGMLNDPVRGFYGGPVKEARGLLWYWTDGGTYGGLYTMRAPHHFARLAQVTGDQRYRDICDTMGETLLARQLPSGFVSAAWNPLEGWMHEVRVGSRYIYAMATFATLWRLTGEERYHAAYECALQGARALQNPDGSFYQMYEPRTGEAVDRSVKLHFASYFLNAFREAYAVTGDAALLEMARRFADYLTGIYCYRQAIPYCTGVVAEPADQMEADSAVGDSAPGLLWLAEETGEAVYRDVALKLWMQAWLHQPSTEAPAGWAGAVIRGVNPSVGETISGVPENRRHLHYNPTQVARCDLWFAVHHVGASRHLLREVRGAALAS